MRVHRREVEDSEIIRDVTPPGEVAQPRKVQNSTMREYYKPEKDRAYYRNDGNKHIPSRGDRC